MVGARSRGMAATRPSFRSLVGKASPRFPRRMGRSDLCVRQTHPRGQEKP